MDNLASDTLKLLEASIREVNEKKTLTPAELENLCKAYKLKFMIEGGGEMEGYSERGSYGYGSYGGGGYGGGNFNRGSYGEWYADGSREGSRDGSYRRSPITGRYISRDGYQMSGHSLRDRMVAKLEEMYDSAATEYEREELRKEIRRIEAEK